MRRQFGRILERFTTVNAPAMHRDSIRSCARIRCPAPTKFHTALSRGQNAKRTRLTMIKNFAAKANCPPAIAG
jgi:hypothetical protein